MNQTDKGEKGEVQSKPEVHKNIPQVEVVGPSTGDPKIEDYKGEYIRKSDGEPYALAVSPADPDGRTHHCMNSVHYWEGTFDQFKKEFCEKGKEETYAAEAKTKADVEAREKARKEHDSAIKGAEKKSDK